MAPKKNFKVKMALHELEHFKVSTRDNYLREGMVALIWLHYTLQNTKNDLRYDPSWKDGVG